MKTTTDEELTIEQLYNMLDVYKSKLDNTDYALFIRPSAYEKLKDEIDQELFYIVRITDAMPNDKVQAIIVTKCQYDKLFGGF